MSLLLLDMGNTRTKWAVCEDSAIVHAGRIDNSTLDKTPKLPEEIVDRLVLSKTHVWISCVTNADLLHFVQRDWLGEVPTENIHVARVAASLGSITNHYRNLDQLGVDRWVACFGARRVYPQGDVIIVDAGTAVTVDWLSVEDAFMGGAILPGASLMHGALVGQTAGINAEQLSQVGIVGQTTTECVNSGVIYGLAGAVENVVSEMQKKIGRPTQRVLCGGAAELLLANKVSLNTTPEQPFCHEPHLVLLGLLAMSELDQGAR